MGFTFARVLCSLLVTLISLCAPARAKDALAPGESIADGETLVSAGKVFELGFFSPGSSRNRYVGIWYYQFSTDTVLWVANRERPVQGSNGSVAVGPDGNILIRDGGKAIVWSSNASLQSNASTARLQDDGNLELVNSGGVAWQSFDHPTDTYLPGMKVGLDLTTNVNQYMTSWRSKDDPAPGNYTLGMDPQRSTQIFMWEGDKLRWRSGRWNGQVFIGIQNMVPTYIYGFKLSNFQAEKKMYFYYTAFNSSHRYVLTSDGVEQHLVWKNDTSVWSPFWQQPVTDCELYNKCGDYAACTDKSTPKCACLKGFVPASEDEWRGGNWTRGCVRRTTLQCERNGSVVAEADGFWKMEGIKLPDLSDWYSNVASEDDCRAACASNCSCKAYAFPTGIGCLIWGADLVDIHVFSSGGNDMYLRLAGSELDKKKKVASFVIVIIVLGIVLSLAFICLWWKCWRRKGEFTEFFKRWKRQGADDATRDQAMITYAGPIQIANERNDATCEELPLLSFDSIAAATSGFSGANLLGEGGFGPVYKGMLPGGQEIAVKRLSRSSGQGQEEFKNEVILIAKLQHRNLVRLLGCCVQREERILVYEYMPNKSLDAFLFDSKKKLLLDWKTRFNIIEGIARGLVYLHRDSRLRIIHRDLKASNILLDNDMYPKISDFGMARIFGSDDKVTNTKRVVGTYGYMSPEYAMQGEFSVKSDVYSFGVLLLEIISGKKNSTYSHPELSLNLLGYAWKLWNEDNSMEFVDMAIRDSCSVREVSRCINIGLLCVQDRPNDRPTMSSIVVMLESSTYATPVPRQPTFAAQRSPAETESVSFDRKITSTNNSITILIGR